MERHPEQTHARELLKAVIYAHCRIGIVVVPASPLEILGREALKGLSKILSTNKFNSSTHQVFFDEGIFSSVDSGEREARGMCGARNCEFHFEQRSVKVLGLQVADLIAHTCATMLLAELGFN